MIALETEHGRFEADTMRQAATMAKRAKAAAAQREKVDSQNREIAYARAGNRAYWLIRHKREGRRPAHSWLCRPGDRHFRCRQTHQWGASESWEVWVADGVPNMELIGYRPAAALYRVSGDLDMVWIESCDRPEDRECLTVGYQADQFATAQLPWDEFPPEWFRPNE